MCKGMGMLRPFCLTCAITPAHISTHTNQTVHAICCIYESSSSCLLGSLSYEVKLTIKLTLLELENSAGTINEFFDIYLACFSVLG